MGEAAFAVPPFPTRGKPREEWAKDFTDAEIRRALERLDLSAREHMQLERLCILSLREGYAFMGQENLSRLLRCSVRTLHDVTKNLCQQGLLETTRTRESLWYRPQWEAIGLEGPDSERERAGQRPAKSAGSDRQISPMLLRSKIRSRSSESSRAREPIGRTPPTAPDSTPVPAAEASLSEIRGELRVAPTARPSLQNAPESPSATPRMPGARPSDLLIQESLSAPSGPEGTCRAELSDSASDPSPGKADPPGSAEAGPADLEGRDAIVAHDFAVLAAEMLDLPAPPANLALKTVDPHARVPLPATVVVAAPDLLAQVLEKFGPEAYTDVLGVLHHDPVARTNPTAAFDALDRLLEMGPSDFKKSAGACYRNYVRHAADGSLRLAKTHPRGGTKQARLVRALDLAEQSGDQEHITRTRERLWEYGVARREQVQALRQLQPQEMPFFSVAEPAPRALPAPRVRALPAPPTHDLHAEAEALRAHLALPIFPSKRAQLERELADVEAAIVTKEPTHAQQGQQTCP